MVNLFLQKYFISLILGINYGYSSESALYYPVQSKNAPSFGRKEWEAGLKHVLSENGAYGSNAPKAIQKIMDFYENQTLQYSHNEYLQSYIQLFSDLHFNVPLLREVKDKNKKGNFHIKW